MTAKVSQLFDLSGKVALVTGGARHLGLDAADILAAAGCDVAITSRTISHAEKSAVELQSSHGREFLPLAMDQTRPTDVQAAIDGVVTWKNRIDILVNNAGGNTGKSEAQLLRRHPADIAETVALNLTGLLYCCQSAGRIMERQRSGKIINIASIAGLVGRDRRIYQRSGMNGQPVDYAAAKAGVIGATLDLAGYFSPMGIHVNAISPGGFERGQPARFIEEYGDRTPLARMGRDGTDLKGAILFLASPASDYVTGQNLTLDGGFSIWR